MNEKEKENVKEAEEEEEEEEEGIWVREQRKRKRSRRRRRREEQLADRLDLAPASDGGQRQRAEVRGQTFVIFLFFFSIAGVSEPRRSHSEPCQSCVGEAKKKKKKRDTRRTPESSESYPYRCPTRVRHQHDAKNGVSVQPRKKEEKMTNVRQ